MRLKRILAFALNYSGTNLSGAIDMPLSLHTQQNRRAKHFSRMQGKDYTLTKLAGKTRSGASPATVVALDAFFTP